MNKFTNKQNDENKKPYLFFDFDHSQLNDPDILDNFYTKKFQQLSNRREYYIHNTLPDNIQTQANTGCLIGRNFSQNLRNIMTMFHGSRIRGESKVVQLKNFKYLNGKIRNSKTMVRVVKEYNSEEYSFGIIHFFQQAPKDLQIQIKGQQESNSTSKKTYMNSINLVSGNINIKQSEQQESLNRQVDLLSNQKIEEDEQDIFYQNYCYDKTNDKTLQNSYSSKINNNDNRFLNKNINNKVSIISNNPINQNNNESEDSIDMTNMEFNSILKNTQQLEKLPQIQKNEKHNTLKKLRMENKKEYQELDILEQKNVAEQEAKYYKDLFIKEQIKSKEQSKKLLELEIKQLQQQLSRNSPLPLRLSQNDDKLCIID